MVEGEEAAIRENLLEDILQHWRLIEYYDDPTEGFVGVRLVRHSFIDEAHRVEGRVVLRNKLPVVRDLLLVIILRQHLGLDQAIVKEVVNYYDKVLEDLVDHLGSRLDGQNVPEADRKLIFRVRAACVREQERPFLLFKYFTFVQDRLDAFTNFHIRLVLRLAQCTKELLAIDDSVIKHIRVELIDVVLHLLSQSHTAIVDFV